MGKITEQELVEMIYGRNTERHKVSADERLSNLIDVVISHIACEKKKKIMYVYVVLIWMCYYYNIQVEAV